MSVVVRWLGCDGCQARWVTRETFSHLIAVDGKRVSRAAPKPSASVGRTEEGFATHIPG